MSESFQPLIAYVPDGFTNNHKVNKYVEITDLLGSIRSYLAMILDYF
ncbi:hypothetical protein [Enterococcus florum]|nr:hypothetical protein [Enterococcus florum]